jgi:hypothetical protein
MPKNGTLKQQPGKADPSTFHVDEQPKRGCRDDWNSASYFCWYRGGSGGFYAGLLKFGDFEP